jgi:hypothetical protein
MFLLQKQQVEDNSVGRTQGLIQIPCSVICLFDAVFNGVHSLELDGLDIVLVYYIILKLVPYIVDKVPFMRSGIAFLYALRPV